MNRDLPAPTQLSRGFWAAAAEHRLVVPGCGTCGARFFPPERLCPACGALGWEYVDHTGSGIVSSFTVVHRPPSPGFETPYVVAVVELDGECSMLTNLVGADPDEVLIGMPVHVMFLDHPDSRALPVFAPGVGERPHQTEKG